MISNLERFWLSRYIRTPKRSFLQFGFLFMIVGIILSVSILSAGLNLFEGYQHTLKSLTLNTVSHISIASVSERSLPGSRGQEARQLLLQQQEVKSVYPILTNSVMMQRGAKVRGCYLKAYDPLASQGASYHDYISAGSAALREGKIIIGYYLAEELGLKVGDFASVVYPQLEKITPLGFYPSQRTFEISGIYRSGFYEYDRSLILCSRQSAEELLGIKDRITYLEVYLHDKYLDKADDLSEKFEELVGQDLYITNWKAQNQGLFRLIVLEKWLIFILFSFLVLIAGLNVVSAVTALIYDKKAEIAILKAFGAKDRIIARLFNLRIALTCIFSIIIGQILGTIISFVIVKQGFYQLKGEVYFIDQISMRITPLNQLAIFLVATMMCYVCIVVPLRQIAKMQIIDILRNK